MNAFSDSQFKYCLLKGCVIKNGRFNKRLLKTIYNDYTA